MNYSNHYSHAKSLEFELQVTIVSELPPGLYIIWRNDRVPKQYYLFSEIKIDFS